MSLLAGVVLGILSLVGYGLSDYFGSVSSKKAGWHESVTVSRAISFLSLLLVLILFFKIPHISLSDAILLIIAGTLSNVGLQLFYNALNVGNLSVAAPLSNVGTVVTIVLVLLFFKTTLGYLQALFIFLIIIGTVLTSFKYKDLRRLSPKKLVAGSEYALLSAFIWGIGIFVEIILVKDLGWFIPALFVYLVMLFYNLVYSINFHVRFVKVRSVLIPTALAGLTAVAGFLTFNYGVVLNYAVIVTPLSGAAPMLTVLLGLVLLKEKLEANQALGIVLILISTIALSLF